MKINFLFIALLSASGGWYAAKFAGALPDNSEAKPAADAAASIGYQCPMHPWVKSAKPAACTLCGMDLVAGGTRAAASAGDIVMLPPGSPHVMGLSTVEVKLQPLVRTLRVAGMIGEDESRHGIICAPVEGRIDGLAMSCEGEKVTRRQPLATLFSRTLLNTANEYKLALTQAAPAAETLTQQLLRHGLVWEQIAAIPTRQEDDIHFGMLAPLSGTIVKSYVSEGQYVKEGDKLFEVADFSKMWFTFTVSEPDLPLLQKDQIVAITTPSLPGETLKARVAFISPNLDELTRAAHVRVVLENPERRLKNKTYAEGVVELEAPPVLTIPRGAVVWSGSGARVFVEQATGAYEVRTIKLGRAGDSTWEILEGLEAGERVVLTGNQLLDGQAQLEQHFSQR